MGANAQTTVPSFSIGQVLTADQMNQSARTGVPVFADTTARDAAFGGSGEKTLAEGQLCYLESTNVVQYYDGASWATVGPATSKIAQVVSATYATAASTTSGSFVDTGLTVTITPTVNTSTIFVCAMPLISKSEGANSGLVTLLRNSTNLIVPTSPSSRTPAYVMMNGNFTGTANQMAPMTITWLDSPATTSATTYKIQYRSAGGSIFINRTSGDTDDPVFARGVSSIIAMEVLA